MATNKFSWQSLRRSQLLLPVTALIIMLIVNVAITPSFFKISIQNGVLYGYTIDILNRSCELIILAVGMTLAVASSRGTDISVGAIEAVAAAVCVRLLGSSYDAYAVPIAFAVFMCLFAGTICGAFNGFLVSKLNIQPMIATIILFTAGRGIAQLLSAREINGIMVPGQILYVRMESFKYIGGFIPGCVIPTPVFIAAVFVLLTVILLKRTALGLYIETVGINPKAGRLVGINSTLIIFFTYVFCGLASGLAGLIASSRIYSSDANNIGLNMELDAILAVALGGNSLGGGKFNIAGSVIGAVTIQALTTGLYAMGVSGDQLPVYKAVVVVLIVTLQSDEFKRIWAAYKVRHTAVQEAAK
jgi:galactofuranose transport system permease protein